MCALEGDSPGGTLEQSSFGDDLQGFPWALARGLSDAFVIAGTSSSTPRDAFVAVRDVEGAAVWSDVYAGSQGLDDEALAVAVDAEGFVHVLVRETIVSEVGDMSATIDARLVVLRYTPEGTLEWRWERAHEPVEPMGEYRPAGALELVGDEIAVLEVAHDEQFAVVRLDGLGHVLGEVTLALPEPLASPVFDLAPDDAALLAGHAENSHALWAGRFDDQGTLAWSDQFGSLDTKAALVAAGLDGAGYLVWGNRSGEDIEYEVRRYEPDGSTAWTAPMGLSSSDDLTLDAAVRCDDALMLVTTREEPPTRSPWAKAFSPAGAELWTFAPEPLPPLADISARAVALTASGDALVVGSLFGDGMATATWFGRISGG